MSNIIQLPDIGFLSYGCILRLHVQNRDLKHIISHHRTIFLKGCDPPQGTKMGPSLSILHEMSSTSASLTPLEMNVLVSGSLIVNNIRGLVLSFQWRECTKEADNSASVSSASTGAQKATHTAKIAVFQHRIFLSK